MLIPQPIKLRPAHLDVMNFLNEIVMRYPAAISFAPGRPADQFCDIAGSNDYLTRYITEVAEIQGDQAATIRQSIGQYSKTNGIINALICRFLALDEQIQVEPAALMVTNGTQEAMAILAAGLFQAGEDVLLVADPAYNGMSGIASILGVEIQAVPTDNEGLDFAALQLVLQQIRTRGKHPRALYIIPDFNNPLGTSMLMDARQHLLNIAYEQDILLFEDNPYGMLAYDMEPLPTLKALDSQGVVVYLGTFAKLLFPGLRVGFMVADQRITTSANRPEHYLAQELSKVKSLVSVSTSPLAQAIVGGILLEEQFSLKKRLHDKIAFYRANRDQMLQCLDDQFGNDPSLSASITWNRPHGGLFLTITLPFEFTPELLQQCTEEYGVICCPMSYFTLLPGREHQIRLSFSAISQANIIQGIARLKHFVSDTLRRNATIPQ